jgi:hypothetical protein
MTPQSGVGLPTAGDTEAIRVFIRTVDDGLERLLRASLPLPPDVGDVSFDTPTGNWSAQLSRITVNLFLYQVSRSTDPSRTPVRRVDADGVAARRLPQPMVQLGYLVSAWAGSPRDEHQLLGDTLSRLASLTALPDEYLPDNLSSSVQLNISADPDNRAREVFSAAGAQLKAAFTLVVTVAADTFDWSAPAPPVQQVATLLAPIPRTPDATAR